MRARRIGEDYYVDVEKHAPAVLRMLDHRITVDSGVTCEPLPQPTRLAHDLERSLGCSSQPSAPTTPSIITLP